MATFGWIITAFVGVAVAVVAVYYFGQRSMLFPAPAGYAPPEAVGLAGVQEDPLVTADGETVMVWSKAAPPGAPTLVLFHGNGERLPDLADRIAALSEDGWGIAAATYRKYPGSTGQPTEERVVSDAIAVFDRLVERDGVRPDDIVLYGYSLGSAAVMGVAEVRTPGGIVLEGSMSSIEDVAKHHFPWLPVRTLIRDRFNSAARAAEVTAPVFVIHGERDGTVPIAYGKRLYDALPDPKAMFVVPGGGHVLPPGTGWDEFLGFADQHGVPTPQRQGRAQPAG